MKNLILPVILILLMSCSPDTLRPNCLGKRAYAKAGFEQNPFIKNMDMYSLGQLLHSTPRTPIAVGEGRTLVRVSYEVKVLKHNYMVEIDHVQDRKKPGDEYTVNIFINPKEYYKCSYPVGYVRSDINQIIHKIPLKDEYKNQLFEAIEIKTIESKKLDIY